MLQMLDLDLTKLSRKRTKRTTICRETPGLLPNGIKYRIAQHYNLGLTLYYTIVNRLNYYFITTTRNFDKFDSENGKMWSPDLSYTYEM